MKISKNKLGLKIFTVLWLLFIFASAIVNYNLFSDSLTTAYNDELGFKGFIEQVKTSYTSDLKQKTSYININGLFAKLTGRTVYNKNIVLKNGMLANTNIVKLDMVPCADKISVFNKYLSEKGIKYLYIQAPYKLDLDNELLPVGVENYANINADSMVERLKYNNVDVLDLREFMAADVESIEKYFYNTDHHWNNDGAFLGFQKTIEKINTWYDGKKIESEFLDKSNWNQDVYENIFLGSQGKRVGKYFAGTDDLIYFSPKIATNMSVYNTKYTKYFSGDFDTANKREEKLVYDYFSRNQYTVYLGGEYPIVKHFNTDAASDLKVLIIKDSYTLPYQAFMSTIFSRIDVVDPRHLKTHTLSEYVECYNPDIVIEMINPTVFQETEYFDFGIEKCKAYNNLEPKTVKKVEKYKVKAEGKKTYRSFKSELSPKTKYTFKFSDIRFTSNENERMTVALYNAKSKKIVDSHIFDLEFCNSADSKEWTFITPKSKNGKYKLLVFAGEYKQIDNDELVVIDAELIRYE